MTFDQWYRHRDRKLRVVCHKAWDAALAFSDLEAILKQRKQPALALTGNVLPGLCLCGCGQPTKLNKQKGHYKEKCLYLAGHNRRVNPSNNGNKGPNHYAWKGDNITLGQARRRALKMYPNIGPCVKCGSAKSMRHHVDGNPLNNSPENIMALCGYHHLEIDGRLEKIRQWGKHFALRSRRETNVS